MNSCLILLSRPFSIQAFNFLALVENIATLVYITAMKKSSKL